MRIAIAGTGRLGTSLLLPLLKTRHEVVAIVQDGRNNRGLLKRRLVPRLARWFGGRHSMTGHARAQGIPIFWIDKMTPEELAPLAALEPDILLVGGFAIILKKPLLELPRIACINAHSSLLPRHRGPNPFYAVIMQGDTESGVTFHLMDEGIDTGPILKQAAFAVGEEDSSYDIYKRACAVVEKLVVGLVDEIQRNGLQPIPQDENEASYDPKVKEADSWLDWTRPAVELHRMVRALSPTPMPRFSYQGQLVRVARTEVDPTPVDAPPGTVLRNHGSVTVATGAGALVLRVAFVSRPLPWVWPSLWSRPPVGAKLED